MDMTEDEAGASFMVLDYINRELKPDKKLLRRAMRNWMKHWVNMIFRGQGKLNAAANLRLLKQAKGIDPVAELRWMKEMQLYPLNLIWKKVVSLLDTGKKSPEHINGMGK